MREFSYILLGVTVAILVTSASELFQGKQNISAGIFFLGVGILLLQKAGRLLDRRS
jgi:sulfite exporter TauE/SafE